MMISVLFSLYIYHKQKDILQDSVHDNLIMKAETQQMYKEQISNMTECFTSKSHCLQLIEDTFGKRPHLVSFEGKTVRHEKYSQTGKPFLVPNIVHLISFGHQQPFKFYNYVAYKSFQKFIKPDAIFLWADYLPSEHSTWWKRTWQEVANIYFVQTIPLKQIAGKNIIYTAHISDYLRLIIMRGICFI